MLVGMINIANDLEMIFKRLNINKIDWNYLDSFDDRTVFQTRYWLNFLEATQNAEPIIAALHNKKGIVGFFTGCIVRKFGVPILGSPFPGWTTSYMGFNLKRSVCRKEALRGLSDFAFRDLNCLHLELMDRHLNEDDAISQGFIVHKFEDYEIDLRKTEDELFSNMKKSCRWSIRKSVKNGVIIEEADDSDFVDDYYSQLKDVFAKQKLVPTYKEDRVRNLIKFLYPTGMLLLLRAMDSNGKCIATGIFPGFNDKAYFWGGASWRSYQSTLPNEPLQWYAMRFWKARGIRRYEMGGGLTSYKAKFGGEKISVPWIRKSRYPIIEGQRLFFKKLHRSLQMIAGHFKL
jgi:Acetyltransferase (GNAT) domain